MNADRRPVIVAYGRTPIGKAKKGAFRNENPIEFAGQALKGTMERIPELPFDAVEEVIVGCAFPEHLQNFNIARQITFRAGFPDTTTSLTVSRICSSGLQAISVAANAIIAGERDVVAAGGAESMTKTIMYPNQDDLYEYFLRTRPEVYDPPALTGEKVAALCGITREEEDAYALESHRKAVAAQAAGYFEDQIIPIMAHNDDGSVFWATRDEGMRPDTSLEQLAALEPFVKADGVVTAGNSSQMSDGAGFVILMSAEKAKAMGIKPIAEFLGFHTAGLAPEYMGLGPTKAVPPLLKRLGLTVADLDVIELNEAFAAQVIPCIRQLGLPPEKVNPTGGAIAYGHPLGGTGGILTVKVLSYLKRTGGKYGLITMCVGGGIGAAGVVKLL